MTRGRKIVRGGCECKRRRRRLLGRGENEFVAMTRTDPLWRSIRRGKAKKAGLTSEAAVDGAMRSHYRDPTNKPKTGWDAVKDGLKVTGMAMKSALGSAARVIKNPSDPVAWARGVKDSFDVVDDIRKRDGVSGSGRRRRNRRGRFV